MTQEELIALNDSTFRNKTQPGSILHTEHADFNEALINELEALKNNNPTESSTVQKIKRFVKSDIVNGVLTLPEVAVSVFSVGYGDYHLEPRDDANQNTADFDYKFIPGTNQITFDPAVVTNMEAGKEGHVGYYVNLDITADNTITVQPRKGLGRYSPTAGPPQELTFGAGLTMDATGNIAVGFSETTGETLYGRVISPKNSFLRKTTVSTGYLSISIPFTTLDFFVTIRGFIREFDFNLTTQGGANRLTAFSISGHLNTTGNWINTAALLLADNVDRDLPVTFATNGTNGHKIYIGAPSTVWGTLSVTVDEVIYGRPGSSLEVAQSNWVVDINTTGSITEARQVVKSSNLPVAGSLANAVRNNTDTFTSTAAVSQVVSLTQVEYEALTTKDTSTLYVIV